MISFPAMDWIKSGRERGTKRNYRPWLEKIE
jgi:hypothetical protein